MREKKLDNMLLAAVISFVFVLAFLICSQVDLYGDDLFYSTFVRRDISYFISRHLEHYQLANGRVIVHILATIFIWLPAIFWQVINAFFISFTIFLYTKIAKVKVGNKAFTAAMAAFMFFYVSITVTSQSIYWLTGSFNYVYPMFTLAVYWLLVHQIGTGKQYEKFIPLMAFFLAATTEQGSVMCFGIGVLYILKSFIFDKEKPSKVLYLSTFATLLSVLTVLLAPGLNIRVDMTYEDISIFQLALNNIPYMVKDLFFGSSMVEINLILTFFIAIFAVMMLVFTGKTYKNAKILLSVISLLNIFIYLYVKQTTVDYTNKLVLLVAIASFLLMLLITVLLEILRNKNYIPLIALILAYGSQLMLIVSATQGARLYVSTIFMFMLFSVSIFAKSKMDSRIMIAFALCFIVISSKNAYRNFAGYRQNHIVYTENMTRLENGENVQKRMATYAYRWVMPYENSYYIPYYNICYGLDQSFEIIWEY